MNAARRPLGGTDPPRVLIVDDDRTLHDDYERCLGVRAGESVSLRSARDDLFGAGRAPAGVDEVRFELEHAFSGEVAVSAVESGLANDIHYAVAFVDMRMPPGWSGVDTIVALWNVDPRIQIVLCTAYSDFTWDRVIATVGRSEGLHLLRKPFAAEQVRRFAEVLSKKWQLSSATRERRWASQR